MEPAGPVGYSPAVVPDFKKLNEIGPDSESDPTLRELKCAPHTFVSHLFHTSLPPSVGIRAAPVLASGTALIDTALCPHLQFGFLEGLVVGVR